MKIVHLKKWGLGLCALLITSVSYAKCYPGLDCPDDLPQTKPSPSRVPKTGCVSGNCVNGTGTYFYVGGDKYVGEFKNGEKEGQGAFTWADGNKYVGEFKNGEKEGQGTFTWVSGDKYVGAWKNEDMNGLGTIIYTSGKVAAGRWKDDKYLGE